MRRGDHAWGTETTLQGVMFAERGLQRREVGIVRQPFDSHDLGAVRLHREHQACAHGVTIDEDRTGTTHTMFASNMRTGQAQVMAQAISKREPRLDLDRHLIAVYFESDWGLHGYHVAARLSARPTRVPTSARR